MSLASARSLAGEHRASIFQTVLTRDPSIESDVTDYQASTDTLAIPEMEAIASLDEPVTYFVALVAKNNGRRQINGELLTAYEIKDCYQQACEIDRIFEEKIGRAFYQCSAEDLAAINVDVIDAIIQQSAIAGPNSLGGFAR